MRAGWSRFISLAFSSGQRLGGERQRGWSRASHGSVDPLCPCAHTAHVTEGWDCEGWGGVMSIFCFSSTGQDPEAL